MWRCCMPSHPQHGDTGSLLQGCGVGVNYVPVVALCVLVVGPQGLAVHRQGVPVQLPRLQQLGSATHLHTNTTSHQVQHNADTQTPHVAQVQRCGTT